jgi:NADPH2:quinone reductase
MRAVVVEEFGTPEVLQLREQPEPVPGPGQVTIGTAYAGVNFAEILSRSNGYRVSGLPFVPGLEAAGLIRAVGEGVTGFQVGQQVVALLDGGGYAEVALADAARTFNRPRRPRPA